ncbi:MAG: hypothetical protein ABIL45_07990 [candidate division WOR-3 bacterium]
MQKILPVELAKAILNKETGLFIFLNEENEAIRIILRNGEIIKIDGLYGEDETELGRLFLWGTGNVIKRKIPKEYENYIPKKKYHVNGFLKILIESAKKERKVKEVEISLNELIFLAFSNYLDREENFLYYDKQDWIGISKLIQKLSKTIKNSIIYIPNKYIIFFEEKVNFIITRNGYVNFEKLEEENMFEPFDYKLFILSPQEYDILTIPFTKEPDFKGNVNNVSFEHYKIGILYDSNEVILYAKFLNEIEPIKNYKCILWK